jgi:hypothetical protein
MRPAVGWIARPVATSMTSSFVPTERSRDEALVAEPVEGEALFHPGPSRDPRVVVLADLKVAPEAAQVGVEVHAALVVEAVGVHARRELSDGAERRLVPRIDAERSIELGALRIVEADVLDARAVRDAAPIRVREDIDLEVAGAEAQLRRGRLREVRVVDRPAPDARREPCAVGHAAERARELVVLLREGERRAVAIVVLEARRELARGPEHLEGEPGAGADAEASAKLVVAQNVHARVVGGALRDDVDDAHHRVRAVEHRARAHDHLDVVHEVDGDPRALIESRRPEERVVDGVPVDEQEKVLPVVLEHDAARADVGRAERIRRHDAEAEKIDRLGERSDAEHLDVVGGDRRRQRRRRRRPLRGRRSGRDDVLVQERLDVGRVVASRWSGARERREASHDRRMATGHR